VKRVVRKAKNKKTVAKQQPALNIVLDDKNTKITSISETTTSSNLDTNTSSVAVDLKKLGHHAIPGFDFQLSF